MFRDDSNAVFHVFYYSAAGTLTNDLLMSRDFVANILGHASLSNKAQYSHASLMHYLILPVVNNT